jgi:hypothetical protein
MDRPVGICGNCGGTVTVFEGAWGGTQPPEPTCQRCGATVRRNLPVLPMNPPTRNIDWTPPTSPDWNGGSGGTGGLRYEWPPKSTGGWY